MGSGLSGMEELLGQISARRPGDRPLAHLLASYRAALSEPVLSGAQADGSVVFPSLAEAYLTPRCRIGQVQPGDDPASAGWWEQQPVLPDAEVFLTGYLTSLRSVRWPLVVLGEPGSGKSKLTEVLAARLADGDFFPVRVELRDVAAESMILEQIEQAIYRGPGDRASWHDLVEAAGGAQPVVLLDGFDELVQASAVNRYDYLEQVRDFQRRQAQIGHPVAVIVTSRTVVADHTRFPAGTLALQLQPFTDGQVRRWLEVWARSNAPVLAARGLRPLPAQTALAHPELATQPLLLMLLAIYDATRNALQQSGERLSRAGLYEGLFGDFALREVAKSAQNRALPASRQHELAERELQRLAITATAMFSRGKQAVTEAELNRDLPVLFPDDRAADPASGEAPALTPAQRATGRFFFIHRSQARPHDELARSYEFLHSTFGEFLVARQTARALRHLAAMREVMRQGMTPGAGQLDDGFLYATLSFSCLADRVPILDFLREQLGQIPRGERARCQELLIELLAGSLYPHPNRSFHDHELARYPVPRRLAAYSANLVLLLVLLTPGGPISFDAAISPGSLADRTFRDAALLPNWHASMLLLQSVPSIRATSDDIRRDNEGTLTLPGYLLAQLDYTKDAAPAERAALYQHSLDTMASFPDIARQLLLRLREDAVRFDSATVISLLRAASCTEPGDLFITLVNELWWRLDDNRDKQAAITLMTQLASTWPHITRMGLDRHLRAAIKTASGQE